MKGVIMKNRNWFWGIFFLLAAAAVIAIQIETVGQIGIWSLLAGVLLIALLVHSLIDLNFFGVFVPLAFLYMIFWQPLGFVFISPWMLVLAAVLTSIGFSIIFHPKRRNHKECWHWVHDSHDSHDCHDIPDGQDNQNKSEWQNTETIDDNHPYAKAQFSSSSKYLHADALESGKFTVSFGELEIFFDQVQLSPDGAVVNLDCSFASMKLHIPKHWQIIDKLNVSLADVNSGRRANAPAPDAPKLTLTGNVQFGGVEIQYF